MWRQCTKCKEHKAFWEFGKIERGYLGLNSMCKKCVAKKQREYARKYPDKIKETRANWLEKKGKDYLLEYSRKYREEHPDLAKDTMRKVRRENSGYSTWNSMMTRCYCESHRSYKWYGARGIGVCERWKGAKGMWGRDGYHRFIKDMGPKPGVFYQIDRIDPEGDYEPDNCRWITQLENLERSRAYRAKLKGKEKRDG